LTGPVSLLPLCPAIVSPVLAGLPLPSELPRDEGQHREVAPLGSAVPDPLRRRAFAGALLSGNFDRPVVPSPSESAATRQHPTAFQRGPTHPSSTATQRE